MNTEVPHRKQFLAPMPALDGLRFFAASAVIGTHLHSYDFMTSRGYEKYNILVSGTAGVNLFYVLSGFLITTLAIREYNKTNTFSIKNFFLRRALRIFPLYYFVLFVYLFLHLVRVQKTNIDSYSFAFFYIYNFIPKKYADGWLGSFHTLATEEHFYILFPFLFALTFKINRILFLICIIFYISFVPTTRAIFYSLEDSFNISLWSIYACLPIFAGCIMAFVREDCRVKEFMSFIHSRWYSSIVCQIVLFIAWLYFFLPQANGYNALTMAIGFSFLVWLCAEFTSNPAVRLLSAPILVYLGKISYGLYIWQSLILGTGDSSRIVNPKYAAVILILLLSIASYELFEKPILRYKDKLH